MIDEEIITSIVGLTGIVLAGMYSRKYNLIGGVKGVQGKPLPNDNTIEAIRDMWDDEEFLMELSNILAREGDFNELMSKVRAVSVKDEDDLSDTTDIWKVINDVNFKPAPVAKEIISNIIRTNSYKQYVKKYVFSAEDEAFFSKLLLLTIMKPEFNLDARIFIFKSIKDHTSRKKWGHHKITGSDLTFRAY